MVKSSALIGYTGFVGSNLKDQYKFDYEYNSKNILDIVGFEFDLVVCAGVSAVKWLANQDPEQDTQKISNLKHCLSQIKANKVVLISTIDVYDSPNQANEDTIPNVDKQDYYGKHRYELENWISQQKNFHSFSIIRLPGLFGNYLKKNLIFDIMNPLAKTINKSLWEQFSSKLNSNDISDIVRYYHKDSFDNLQLSPDVPELDKQKLIDIFGRINFSTLNFTDSRSSFQFYNLANLGDDINNHALSNEAKVINLSCEPITARELVSFVTGDDFINHTEKAVASYNMYSKFASDGKYLYHKQDILSQIKKLVEKAKK